MARELISDGVQLNASAGIGAGQALRTRAANKGCEQKLRAKRDSRLALRMLNAHRDGKMRTTCATRTKKRRLRFRRRRFRIQTSKEENSLSLAGLAATYSPRA